jgi:hypothetical protein
MRTGLAASLLAVAAFFAGGPCGAAPFGVQLGPDRLVIDTPAGFSDSAGFGSPRLTEIAEMLADPSNRVLVFALSDADFRRFSAGDQLDLRRYLLAVTPRVSERERLSPAQFATLIQEASRTLGKPPEPGTNYRQYLQGLAPGQAHLLAEIRRDEQMLSVLQGTMIPQPGRFVDKPPLFKVSGMALVMIAGKALYISAFSAYDDPSDVAWIRAILARWVEDLQRLNR